MNFRTRIKNSSSDKSKIILANDLENIPVEKLESVTIKNIKSLHRFLCAIKLNFHLIMPLDMKSLSRINHTAHDFGLQTIADIKLNDIGNTNLITTQRLWEAGFDAVIVNAIMGPENLKNLVNSAHKDSRGVITLIHMSHPGAKLGYGLTIKQNKSKKMLKLHDLFFNWSYSSKVDGIVIGATVPEIIKQYHKKTKDRLEIYSPGVGTQGGDPIKTLQSGSDYLIVGRTILNAKDPVKEAVKLRLESMLTKC